MNTIYVGRPSKWGNPFTGPDAFERYKDAIVRFPESELEWMDAGGDAAMLSILASGSLPMFSELRGKDLACWCPLNKKCHADILLKIANM